MALGDVRLLVAHDARQFALVVGRQQQTGIDADDATGHREGVDARVADHQEAEVRRRRRPLRRQFPADAVDVVGNLRILDQIVAAV